MSNYKELIMNELTEDVNLFKELVVNAIKEQCSVVVTEFTPRIGAWKHATINGSNHNIEVLIVPNKTGPGDVLDIVSKDKYNIIVDATIPYDDNVKELCQRIKLGEHLLDMCRSHAKHPNLI